MASPSRFHSIAELELEKARLDGARKHHEQRLDRHWAVLKDPDTRSVLLRNTVTGMISSWQPVRLLSGLVGGASLTTALASAAFRRGGVPKRILFFVASLILPYLLQRASKLSIEEITQHVRATIDRIRERMERSETESVPRDDD